MVTATRFEDTIRIHKCLSAPHELYDNKSKFRGLSYKYCMARGGDESEVVLSATFMFYQLVPVKEK